MAGLWERVKNGADDRVRTHHLVAGLKGYATGLWTKAQVLSRINSLLGSPLTTTEETDLDNIATEIDGLPDTTAKIVYGTKVEALFISAEAGVISETEWRTGLNIS